MTSRWPEALCPVSCTFGRTRNPAAQTGLASQHHYAPARGRPLWTAECSFQLHDSIVEQFRSVIDTMDGMRTPYMLWDFANPYPAWYSGHPGSVGPIYWQGTSAKFSWEGTSSLFTWSVPSIDYAAVESSLDVVGTASIGDTTFVLDGWAASTGVMRRGDLIEIDESLYVLSKTALSDASGEATITIFHGLLSDIATGSDIRVVKPAARMRLDEHKWSIERSWQDQFWSASAKFIEVA